MNKKWYSRTEQLIDPDNIKKLENSHVLVAGLGGVGAYAAEQLCRAGIGQLTIVDSDKIDITNINRQLPALHSLIGRPKTEILTQRFRDINPNIKIAGLQTFLKDEALIKVLNYSKYDYIIDAIDTLSPKIHLILNAKKMNYRIVSSMGAGGKMDPGQIKIADISKSFNCGLARALRKRLHRYGIYKGIKVVFSPEERKGVSKQIKSAENRNTVVGTISYMPAIFGCFCAFAAVNDILNY
ncbi:MAG: tRNA threonylcarbamoyladenosine dehydratase [Victivallales bacterium]|nr:tRNA threonylcarbamoyladenosine dehydratase [Victivallales bacterium]